MTGTSTLSDVLPAEALDDGGAGGVTDELSTKAEAIVHPRSTEEVAETLKWADGHGVGVLPVGSGHRVPAAWLDGRFILLVTDRLSGIEIYEPADVTLTASAGTRLGDVNRRLGEHRQWLPFDPPWAPERTLGGLVASGESGPVATGYGELRNHVLGLTLVCGDGRVLRLGGRVVKNVAGFDLLRPVVGSRGRLGVVTSVCLRAFPVPAEDRLLIRRAKDFAGLAEAARSVRTAPVLPASSVLWSEGDGAALAVRLHGSGPTVDADQKTLEGHAGVTFERPSEGSVLAADLRDRASEGELLLSLSVLPSRLFEALGLCGGLLGDVQIVADAYSGSARLSTDSADVERLKSLIDEVEGLGGAARVVRAGAAGSRVAGSTPGGAGAGLAARVEDVFDPGGVLWPCRV